VLAPTRYKLTADQLAAGLALARLTPKGNSALPLRPPPPDPVNELKASGILSSDGRMTDDAAATLRVAADPSHVVLVTANRAGQELWAAALLLRDSDNGMFVMQAGTDQGGFDFAVLPTLAQATVLVDELLDLTAFGSGSGSITVELDLCAFAALLAAADATREARMAAVVARTTDTAPPELTAPTLEEQLGKGLSTNDTRWAVSAARRAVPVALSAASGRCAAGLDRLASLGLVQTNSPGAFRFTEQGTELSRSLTQLVTTGSVVVLADAIAGRTALAYVTMFRSPFTTWFALWTGLGAKNPHAQLFDATNETALRLVRSLLDATEATRTDSEVLSRQRAADLVVESAAAPAKPPWRPTHLVPDYGMSAWAAPDARDKPVARIDPRVELQLLERSGDWAHIVCNNGWSAWVDGRAINEIPPRVPHVPVPGPAHIATPLEVSAAKPPWGPTHVVPDGGTSAWAAPDPRGVPIARIDPGVEVQLLERSGDWAHIVCNNGWSAWVDRRVIKELHPR
jgi:SH3-like domain-containing protein